MTFFNKVIANESKNRMSLWNISTVMAPNLFFSRSKHSDYEELLLANTAAHIIRLMLKYQKILWKVSDSSVAVECPYEICWLQGDVNVLGASSSWRQVEENIVHGCLRCPCPSLPHPQVPQLWV